MALSAGTRLGPYEILAPLGAGGMGEVYRARDSRLGRDVALKILPEDRSSEPDRLRRFEDEARAVASLNHPHILALHDVGTHDGVPYAVTELLEGRTLRIVLERGPLPSRKVVDYGVQIGRGLAAAHEHGVVHRDLKPENLFVSKDGQIKILDFGLAKLSGPAEDEDPTSSQGPTATEPALVMGTAGYMSPEQARGRPADARSDIFAVGVVLYEMLSGRGPFRRDTHAETQAAMLNEDPPELTSPAGPVPAGLERIVRRCLEKDPGERFQSARDVTFALEAVSGVSDVAALGAGARPRPRSVRRRTIPALAFGAVAAVLAGVLADRLWLRPPGDAREARVLRSHIDLREDRPLRSPYPRETPNRNHPRFAELALSPDGTLLVWTSRPDDDPSASALHLRRLDTGEVMRLPGTDGASQPFFSPDGRWIGFYAREALRDPDWGSGRHWLRKVPAEGGPAVDLAELGGSPTGASWGADGRIFLGSWGDEGIHWAPAEGGRPAAITTVDLPHEVGHRLPSILPGGHALLFTRMPFNMGVRARIEAVSLASGERKVVVEDAADARYLPTGHLVFARQGVVMAAPFDLERLELTSPPVPVVEGVCQALNIGGWNSGAAQFAVSGSGLLAYAPGGICPDTPIELLLLDETGQAEPLPGFDRPLVSPQVRFSPDGRQLVFVEQPRSGLLGLFDVHRHTYRILSDGGFAGSAAWSPDGTQLAAQWSEGGPFQLWLVPTGRRAWERLTESERSDVGDWAPSWSPDGRFLAFVRERLWDIVLYRFEDRQVVPFLASGAEEAWPDFSPDGRWMAYASDETGRFEVYVTSFPDRERTLTVSRHGGMAPAWSRDGRRLFYCSLESSESGRSMMAVSVRHDPALSLGQPTTLFRLPDGFVALYPIRSYEPHPDGRRFVIGRWVKTDPPPPITRLELVHNWFAELQRLSPIGR